MPWPGDSVAGPMWSKKMNGPTVLNGRLGRLRCTVKAPMSLRCGLSTARKGLVESVMVQLSCVRMGNGANVNRL